MKILFVTSDLAYGGAARQLTLLAAGLSRERFGVRVVTTGADTPWACELRDGGVAVESGHRRRLLDVRALFALRRSVREFGPTVIHVIGLPALRSLALTGGRGGARVVLSAAARGEQATPLRRLDAWLIAALADRVTARGPAEAGHYQRLGIRAAKVEQISPCVPVTAPPKLPHADWCRSLGLPEGARVIVAVGPLEAAKGFRDAIWAFDILQFLYDDLHVLLVGSGPHEPRLREFARITQSTGRVHFLGDRADRDELLGHAEVVWVPSWADRGTTVALEAMAAGRPVVGSRRPALAEVIADGETGVLVAPGDKGALARETRLLLDDADRRRHMGEAGKRRAAEQFGTEAMVRRFEALYASLCGAAHDASTISSA
jgi:glycosyltransferase involved in cell wall biosynthesis